MLQKKIAIVSLGVGNGLMAVTVISDIRVVLVVLQNETALLI